MAVRLGQWVNITPCHIKMSDWFVTNFCTTCFSVRGLRGRWQTWGWGQRRTRWGVSKLIKTTQSRRFWALTPGQCWRRVCVNSWVVVPHFIRKARESYLLSQFYITLVCDNLQLFFSWSRSFSQQTQTLGERNHVSQSLPAPRLLLISKNRILLLSFTIKNIKLLWGLAARHARWEGCFNLIF